MPDRIDQYGSTPFVSPFVVTVPNVGLNVHLNIDETIAAKNAADYFRFGGPAGLELQINPVDVPADMDRVVSVTGVVYQEGIPFVASPSARIHLKIGTTKKSRSKPFNMATVSGLGPDTVGYPFKTTDISGGFFTRAEYLLFRMRLDFETGPLVGEEDPYPIIE